MQTSFNSRKWEIFLERHFEFCDVEIIDVHRGLNPSENVEWYGTFKTFSHLIEGAERTYFFKIINSKIHFILLGCNFF